MNSKIFITGVGRSGTTFLMRLLTLLNQDTGYTSDTMICDNKSNSGLEKGYVFSKPSNPIDPKAPRIIKSPFLCNSIQAATKAGVVIELVIVPVRNIQECAESRARLGNHLYGGFWQANNIPTQIQQHYKVMGQLVEQCTLCEVPILFLSFHRMIEDSEYLRQALNQVFQFSDREEFQVAYETAAKLSQPR